MFDPARPWSGHSPRPLAWDALDESGRALQGLWTARTIDQVAGFWHAYLDSQNLAWRRADQSVPASGPIRQWWGLRIKFRREDELLAYLEAARHVRHHHLAETEQRIPGN